MSKARHKKYIEVCARASELGAQVNDVLSTIMDIESADQTFNLRMEEWLNADDYNFLHDFYGIRDNIDRSKGFPAKEFGLFVPRFAAMQKGQRA